MVTAAGLARNPASGCGTVRRRFPEVVRVAAVSERADAAPAAEPVVVELAVGGMTCASCAARVQARLNKLDGVTATVNLATERAWVTTSRPVQDLLGAVEAAGYSAAMVVPAAGGGDSGTATDEAAVQRLRRRLILA